LSAATSGASLRVASTPSTSFAMAVQQIRRAVQADRRLAGSRPALDDERRRRRSGDQAVLVGLDRGDDVPHVQLAAAFELLQQEISDRGAVDDRAVERLVRDPDHTAAFGAKPAAQCHAVRILRRRRVERARGRRLPVDDQLPSFLVVHPAAADVERRRYLLEVEPAEAEALFGVLERPESLRRPGVHRRLRDLAVDAVPRARDGSAHPFELDVRPIQVGLLADEIGMAHRGGNVAVGPERGAVP
jgi:hypothetical protein